MESLNELILAAKLGRARKDAQVDTCTVFAAALYDVLTEQGMPCAIFSVSDGKFCKWEHAVVKVGANYYDSFGQLPRPKGRSLESQDNKLG